jgi:prophage antirepressor-like protein
MKVFEDNDHDEFRVFHKDGNPWFVLTEVCAKLGIANPRDAGSRLDEDEKDGVGITDAIGRTQRTTIISESGLWSLVLRSNKPEAKRFKKWLTSEVIPSIRKTGGYGRATPSFIKRYNDNWDRVDKGHFSVINELVIQFWGRLEHAGHILADKAPDGKDLRPDVSVGRCFSDWMRKNHPEKAGQFSYYLHTTPEWEGEARQYPDEILHLYRQFVDEIWIPVYGPSYLKKRDPTALPYLQKLLPSAAKPKIGMMRNPANQRFTSRKKAGSS